MGNNISNQDIQITPTFNKAVLSKIFDISDYEDGMKHIEVYNKYDIVYKCPLKISYNNARYSYQWYKSNQEMTSLRILKEDDHYSYVNTSALCIGKINSEHNGIYFLGIFDNYSNNKQILDYYTLDLNVINPKTKQNHEPNLIMFKNDD
jgi:hypothetical protein